VGPWVSPPAVSQLAVLWQAFPVHRAVAQAPLVDMSVTVGLLVHQTSARPHSTLLMETGGGSLDEPAQQFPIF
jgi:hypothetical protein